MRSLSIFSAAFDILGFWQRLVGSCSSLGAPDVRAETFIGPGHRKLAIRLLQGILGAWSSYDITLRAGASPAELCEELLGDSVELSSQVLRGRWSLHVYFNGQVCIVATP